MITPRELIAASAVSAAAALPRLAWRVASASLNHRAIPSSAEHIPVIGLGRSGDFEASDSAAEKVPLRSVIVNCTFELGPLFAKDSDRCLSGWADEAGVRIWANIARKFSRSRPALTAIIPATSQSERQAARLRRGTAAELSPRHCAKLVAQFS